MTLTVSAVLTAARDYAVWFDRSRIPDAVAVRMLSDVQRDLLAKAATRHPDRFTATYTTSSWPADTITLPAFERILPPIRLNFSDSTLAPDECPLIPEAEADDYQDAQVPAYYQSGTTLKFAGSGSDHPEYSTASVTYLAAGADLTALTDALVLPDDAKLAMSAALAALFALRVTGMPLDGSDPANGVVTVNAASLSSRAAAAETQWLRQLTMQRAQQTSTLHAGL